MYDTVNIVVLELVGDHRVRLEFDDGAERTRDLFPLLTGPVFEAIRADHDEFAKVFIDPDLGVLCWPNGTDIDAELLRYDDLWNEAARLARSA